MDPEPLLKAVIQGTRIKSTEEDRKKTFDFVYRELQKFPLDAEWEEKMILSLLEQIKEAGEHYLHEYRWS